MPFKTLLIDNYDSFTFNLYQLLAEVTGCMPKVIKNDELTWEKICDLKFDAIVLSPGPGKPSEARDFGVCREVILHCQMPLLGVCLGHQGIAECFGGEVSQAPTVMHGRVSEVFHQSSGLFEQIPSPFFATRYHSLTVTQLPKEMEALAHTASGLLMAARHRERPIYSIQFHPESISTEHGAQLIKNFFQITCGKIEAGVSAEKYESVRSQVLKNKNKLKIYSQSFHSDIDSETLVEHFFSKSQTFFWLDSSLQGENARFSFMGDDQGPLSHRLDYEVENQQLTQWQRGNVTSKTKLSSLFDYLNNEFNSQYLQSNDLPFEFCGGYIGYFGYEMKAECGYANTTEKSDLPDARLIFVDRFIAIDHAENKCYVVAISTEENLSDAISWVDETQKKISTLSCRKKTALENGPYAEEILKRHDDTSYLNKIQKIQEEIKKGETYEACLTNIWSVACQENPLDVYSALRALNPSPYAAFLKFPDFSVLSASPEKFLSVDRSRKVETKPIKGTRPRGQTPALDTKLKEDLLSSEKDRAENLMIVDLLRNDLGRICEVGSVSVKKIFDIESFATVHQLVSTIEGKLSADKSAIDCIRACFPGGSMTGAPKKRTLKILDELEERARGVYSGAIGALSLNGGVDLNIIIRTLVLKKGEASFGVGGAIVDLSQAEEELEETRVKAKGLLNALGAVKKLG